MNVTIFSSSNCAVCHAQMQWFDGQGVSYSNIVIDEDDGGMEKLLEATGGVIQGTPFTLVEVDGTTTSIAGFDRKKLVDLLKLT